MDTAILNGVGKKMRKAYINGHISEEKILEMYKKNKREAESFSLFGYRARDIELLIKNTHNPLLKTRLQECLEEKKSISIKSSIQNETSIAKLEKFKRDACGIGLRKVISFIKREARIAKDPEAKLLLLLLNIEFANISAKQHKGTTRGVIYERKNRLLYQIADSLSKVNWKYGINDEAGKNACYLVYVYLPNGVQLTWHCNDYGIYKCYPNIDAVWDGQICMTMEKILTYIEERYFLTKAVA
jgi:hypothetical protein